MRKFDTGATRDTDEGKLDYDGCLSPLALERFAQYMHMHRRQADGSMRAADNWKKGIPFEAYRKSKWRHDMEFWTLALQNATGDEIEDALCAVWFNVQGYLHELVKVRSRQRLEP
jgi:hypothetical protein